MAGYYRVVLTFLITYHLCVEMQQTYRINTAIIGVMWGAPQKENEVAILCLYHNINPIIDMVCFHLYHVQTYFNIYYKILLPVWC